MVIVGYVVFLQQRLVEYENLTAPGLTSRLAQGQGLNHEPPSWLTPRQQRAKIAVW
jgi:hypothetical protein